jgi:NAD(P)-dependent dehydrogenase (short-subunit alcohol dehydrogenase family)
MIKTILKAFGTVDVAFNNAGTAVVAKAEEMSYEELTRIFNVNLTGLFLTAQAAARVMIARKSGSIINMASMSAHVVNVPQATANYNASKAGWCSSPSAWRWVGAHNVRSHSINRLHPPSWPSPSRS